MSAAIGRLCQRVLSSCCSRCKQPLFWFVCRAPLRSPAPRLTRFSPPLGSHFTESNVAQPDGLFRFTVSPCAFRVSGALPATQMFIAAFKSRSIARPQLSQRYVRSLRESLAFTLPQPEHVLLLRYQRSTTCSRAPVRTVLHSSWRRNSPKAASLTDLARWWFFTMPATFKSSMLMSEYLRDSHVVSLCIASSRWFATWAWRRATFALALARRFEPLIFRLSACWARFSFRSDFRR